MIAVWPARLVVFVGVSLTLSVAAAQGDKQQPLRIMPLGDSQTLGYHVPVEQGSYRKYLETQLINLNVDFDFVGDMQRGNWHQLNDPDLQAVSGHTIEQMVQQFGPAIAKHEPQILLVLAGTNNHWSAPDYDEHVDRFESLIQLIQTNAPGSEMIFATLPDFGCCRPETDYWTKEWVTDRNNIRFPTLNKALRSAVAEEPYASLIEFGDAVVLEHDVKPVDSVHLTEFGQFKLGSMFLSALAKTEAGRLDASNIDHFSKGLRNRGNDLRYDIDNSGDADFGDYLFLIETVIGTSPGDSNLDGKFTSADLYHVFRFEEYDDQIDQNSGWNEGDWNGDGEFNSRDLVTAFKYGRYVGLRAVPEPRAFLLFLFAALIIRKEFRPRMDRNAKD